MAASDATLKARRKSHVPGNVRVISYKANRLRNNGTFIEIMQVAIDAARLHNVYGDF